MQRKVFRIETMIAGKRAAASGGEQRRANDELAALRAKPNGSATTTDGDTVQGLRAELARVHDTVAQNMRDLSRLLGDGQERRMARAADELGAAVDGMETATEKILKSAEVIDESARALTATLKDDYKRGLALDIQDHVVRLYESCNFQDLAGQRIGKVIAALTAIEEQIAEMLARCNGIGAMSRTAAATPAAGGGLLNGPKLDGDPGHASQGDIDKMFGLP